MVIVLGRTHQKRGQRQTLNALNAGAFENPQFYPPDNSSKKLLFNYETSHQESKRRESLLPVCSSSILNCFHISIGFDCTLAMERLVRCIPVLLNQQREVTLLIQSKLHQVVFSEREP